MSQVLTVPTHFNDLGELSEGFLDRVEQDTLILYGPVAYEDGSEIEFAVLLADGSPALEGTGRVRAAVDGGAERVPETRYDVVVESLQLDGHSEVVFERLVLARQSVSDRPAAAAAAEEEDEPATNEMAALPSDDEPIVDQAAPDTVPPEEEAPDTVPPDEEAPDTVPPAASVDAEEDDYDYDDEPATVIAAVDAEAMMAVSEPAPEAETVSGTAAASEPAAETVSVSAAEPAAESESESVSESVSESESVPVFEPASASEPVFESDADDVLLETRVSEVSDWDAEAELSADAQAALESNADQEGGFDSEYAFEHGIAEEPQVGMPVPVPSMAAPPEAPPAPPTLRLAEPPEGLTRPSLARVEESLFAADGEVSDVHTTGLFVYENGLPIPSRPPLPDPDGPRNAVAVEAVDGYDVEESDPPEAHDDGYEEIRLSDFAEAAEEG